MFADPYPALHPQATAGGHKLFRLTKVHQAYLLDSPMEVKMVSQNARFAAIVAFGKKAGERLDQDMCPRCGKRAENFRDKVSQHEWVISGLCQPCQDAIFVED